MNLKKFQGSFLLVVIMCVVLYKLIKLPGSDANTSKLLRTHTTIPTYMYAWRNLHTLNKTQFIGLCLSNFTEENLSLDMLPEILTEVGLAQDVMCRSWFEKFNSIYSINEEYSNIMIPEGLEIKMDAWLGGQISEENITSQKVVMINNEVMGESTLFNALRSKRPISKPKISQSVYIEQITLSSKVSCDFCNYSRNTASDPLGRIESEHAYTAVNAFQLDKLHAMSVFRGHHPTNWSQEAFFDVFHIAGQWLKKAYALHPRYLYPVIYWDLLPKAGGSQIHPHIHMILSRCRNHGKLEVWKQAALKYTKETGQNYFNNVRDIHQALGLTVQYKNSSALVSLNEKRDHELLLLSNTYGDDFITLLYLCIRVYFEDFEKYAISLAISLPSMDTKDKSMPLFARMVTRGDASTLHSDVTSMELFSISSASIDSFKFAKKFNDSMRKRLQQLKL